VIEIIENKLALNLHIGVKMSLKKRQNDTIQCQNDHVKFTI